MSKPRRSPWPYAITAYFLTFIVGLVVFAVRAGHVRFDLVTPDYYGRDTRYQEHIEALGRTKALPERPACVYDGDSATMHITFPAALGATGLQARARLYRPSDARLDRNTTFVVADAPFLWPQENLLKGQWKLQLDWEMDGKAYYLEEVFFAP